MKNKASSIIASTLLLAILAGCNFPTPTPTGAPTAELALTPDGAIPVIIDTDMATDDWQAILFLLNRRDVNVLAIAVTGTGEAHCNPGVENAAGLVALADYIPIPIACGRNTPWKGSHVFPMEWRDAMDNMLGMQLPSGENPAAGMTVMDLYESILNESPEPVTILSLGPMTNLGQLFTQHAELAVKTREIVSMGGAVNVAGNVTSEYPNSEWNIYIDPAAANIAFDAGVAVVLVPLDATNQAPITSRFANALRNDQVSASAQWVADLYESNSWLYSGSSYFWDQMAAAIMVERDLAEFEQAEICVTEEEGANSGRMRTTAGCPLVQYAAGVDVVRFEQVFLDGLNGR